MMVFKSDKQASKAKKQEAFWGGLLLLLLLLDCIAGLIVS